MTNETTAKQEDTKTVTLVPVLVTRSAFDKIRTDVPEYEIDLLKAAHGQENIVVLEDEDTTDVEVTADALGEYERMRKKYNGKQMQILERVYPTPADFARASGLGQPKNAGAKRSSAEASQASVNTRKANQAKAGKAKK